MKKVSQMLAERKKKKRLKAVAELEPLILKVLGAEQSLVITPGEFGWPELLPEELNVIGSSLEDQGFGTVALNIQPTDDKSGDVVLAAFGRNITIAWNTYRDALKQILSEPDVDVEWRNAVIEGVKQQHLVTQERYGVQLQPLEV